MKVKHLHITRVAILYLAWLFVCGGTYAQTNVTLNADGPGNTYELINSVLAPGYTAVETPDCAHPAYGRHIAEVFDATLNKNVFEFYSHVAEDNDRCISFDRQRVEIKTYDQSPEHLIGRVGETVTYQWQFRLTPGFQVSSSFTHIHQVKAVGGDESNPIFTLTPRKGTPNKMELIYVGTDNVTNKVAIVNLSLFAGVWVEATETLNIGPNGTYSIVVKRLSDNVTVLSYSNNNIATIRPTNDFLRPKWGIYRSLNNAADLRDDSIRFGTISIAENNVLPVRLLSFNASAESPGVILTWSTANEINHRSFSLERSADGIDYQDLATTISLGSGNVIKNYSGVDASPLPGKNFYRLKIVSTDGSSTYSPVVFVSYSLPPQQLSIFPNPVKDRIQISMPIARQNVSVIVRQASGKAALSFSASSNNLGDVLSAQLYKLSPGFYFISVFNNNINYQTKFLKQ
jgi:hypothetical protein